MIILTHIDRRSTLIRVGLMCLLFYLPGNLGLSTDLVDGLRGLAVAGDRPACGCDGSSCCCGAPCCAPVVESRCGDSGPACCSGSDEPDSPDIQDAEVVIKVVCTCGLDQARTRALVFSCDQHVLTAVDAALYPIPHVRISGPGRMDGPAPALDPPERVPKHATLD